MKTLREYMMSHPLMSGLPNLSEAISSVFNAYADLTQKGVGKSAAYGFTFGLLDSNREYENDGELSQYDNSPKPSYVNIPFSTDTPKTNVSKIVPRNRFAVIEEQRMVVQNMLDNRDAAYLEMRERYETGGRIGDLDILRLAFAEAYMQWKDEVEKLRRMVAE